ncbi:integrase core domain-containing protein, partial [Actinoplanes sp. NPDC051861]|uniref:integrase core domain-containing protein n=1 Tax=Actinoplanes sp. NPDC051861 TaxID=3155170 RepID=UPI0034307C3E
ARSTTCSIPASRPRHPAGQNLEPPLDKQESIRGCQYTSSQHTRLARDNGVRLSVGRRGQCWDNAVAESFFATIKTELVHRQAWPTRATCRQAIFEYIEGWYNTRRRHSSLGYLSPAAYETGTSTPPLPPLNTA